MESTPKPAKTSASLPALPAPVAVLGVPFDKVTMEETLRLIEAMIASGKSHYAATANVDFVVQALKDVELRRILTNADLVLCDGTPLVWVSRIFGNPLPERVAGSDLVPRLLAEAEQKGWRIFFLGSTDASLAKASANVRAKHPKLQLVGTYSPPFKPLLEMDHKDIVARVRAARPDVLLVAFGCPKQEKWISLNYRQANVPLSIGVGATIDFLAGTVSRAPMWMQRSGLEWIFRLLQEPRRLFRRYFTDLWVIGFALIRQWWQLRGWRKHADPAAGVVAKAAQSGTYQLVRVGERLDAPTVTEHEALWPKLAASGAHLVMDLSRVGFIDSTGTGLLVRLNKQVQANTCLLVLAAPSKAVERALKLMRLEEFFSIVPNLTAARELIQERSRELHVVATLNLDGPDEPLAWQGDITSVTEERVWAMTEASLDHAAGRDEVMNINLADVRFMDTAGVRLMVRVHREAQQRGISLRFTQPSPTVQNVLQILRLEQYLLK